MEDDYTMSAGTPPNALSSLYGQGHVDATRTRECVAMPGKREQEVLTPPSVIEAVQSLWPGTGIELDPCSNAGRHVPAAEHYVWPEQDGLTLPWRDCTYVNPPYGDLKKWMAKSASERVEHVMLVPVRTHRVWFDLSRYDAVGLLKPVKFVGFAQAFPAPLALLYRGLYRKRFADCVGPLCTQTVAARSIRP